MPARLQTAIVRFVIAALLAVNFASAADVHAPAVPAGETVAVADAHHGHEPPHDTSHDLPAGDEGLVHDHCLHCYGGNVHQPTATAPELAFAALPVGVLLPALQPDRPPSRHALPPERPPRA